MRLLQSNTHGLAEGNDDNDDDDGNDDGIYKDDNGEVESEKGVDECEDNGDGNDEDNDYRW